MKPLLHPLKKKRPLVSFPTYCQSGSIGISRYAFWLKVASLPSSGFVHIHSDHVTSPCFIAAIFVTLDLKINETLPEGSQHGYNMLGICCAVSCNSRERTPELQFYSISKELDRRNKWLASIRRDHWQLGLPTSEKENKRPMRFFIGEGMLKYLYCTA